MVRISQIGNSLFDWHVPDLFHGVQLVLLNLTMFQSLLWSELVHFVQMIQQPGYYFYSIFNIVLT